MIFSPAILLLMATTSCGVYCVELTQPSSMVVKPQESFSISCRISESSYCINWIRQSAGRPLEWLGYLCSGGSTNIKDSVENKISFTQDTSKNTVFLQGRNFQTEDTAVYYCARHSGGYAFDYWGKGTMVTVSSAQPSAPQSVFGLSQCSSGSDGSITLGCLAKGFSPADSLNFKWKDPAGKDLSDFVQYPAFGKEGDYTKISHIRVRKSDWDAKKPYTCEASNSVGAPKTASLAPPVIRVSKPSMALLSIKDGIMLECQLNDYYPEELDVQWLSNGQHVTTTTNRMLQNRKGEKTFTYISQLHIGSSNDYKKYTCKATHKSEVYQQEYDRCTANFLIKPSIQILKDHLRDIIKVGKVTFSCIVKAPDNTIVSWLVDGQHKQHTTQGKDLSNNFVSNLTVTKDLLKKTIVCTARHPCFPDESARFQADDIKKDPVVVIRRSFMDLSNAVLECVVRDLPPGEVCITFQANNVDISELDCVDLAPSINSLSLIRPFTIPSSHQKKQNVFTCKVQRPFKQWTSKPTGGIFDNASLELVTGSRVVQSSSAYQKLLCSATGFYPEIQWLSQFSVKPSNSLTVTLMQDGHVKVYSEILVPQDEWNKGFNYTCRTTDGPSRETVEQSTSICSVIAPSSQQADVYLLGPPLNFARSDLNLTCIVIGQDVKYFIIQWKVNGNTSYGNDQTPVQHSNGTQSKVNKLKVSVNAWNSHALFTCEVKHLCSVDTQQQSILKTSEPKQPTVRILRPSDSDLSGVKNTSLVCFISDFFPSDILVEWKLNKKLISKSQFTNSPVVAHSSGGYSMHSALILPGDEQKDDIYYCEVSHESSQRPIIASLENLYASLHHSAPSAELLQGADGLMCLVSGFSPSSINITWFMGMTEMSEQNKTQLAKDPDGKFIIQSHLPLKPSEWAPGEVYTCRVTHVTGTQWFNISKNSVISEEAIFMNEIKPEFIPQDTVGEVWNMACAFLILFLLALVYGCTVTLVKVKSE